MADWRATLRGMRLLWPHACAALAAGCNPQTFDDLSAAPRDAASHPVEAGTDAGEPEDAGDGPDVAEPEDAATDASDAGEEPCPERPPAGHVYKVKAARELGALAIPDAGAFRVLSGTTRLGDHILWSFDNASFTTEPPVSYPSAASSALEAPLELSDLVDDDGLPRPSVQRLPEDDPAVYTFDPGSVVATSEHAALLFFQRVAYLTPVSVGVVHVDARGGGVREPAALFESPDPLFFVGGFVDDGFLYLYSSEPRENDANSPLGAVVRAPVLEAARRSSYRAWSADAQGWVADLQQRTAVLSRAPRSLSVAYNGFLGGYLAVFSAPSGDAIELLLAPAPQGPFRALDSVKTEASPFEDLPTFFALQHAALSSACDRRIVLSYTLPAERTPTLIGPIASDGETRLLQVELE